MPKAYLEPNEVEQLEEAATYLRDKLLIRLLFRLGCRISEALGISVGDIDFNQATISIEHLKRRTKLSCPQCGTKLSRTSKFCPGCGSTVEKAVAEEREHRRKRTLPIDEATLKLLREYIDRGGPVETGGQRLLFGLGRGQAWRILRECASRAKLGQLVDPETGSIHNVSPHRLRDAFAVHAIKIDGSSDGLRLLQEHLGHQNITTTMRYRKVAGEEHRKWYQKLWGQEKYSNDAAS